MQLAPPHQKPDHSIAVSKIFVVSDFDGAFGTPAWMIYGQEGDDGTVCQLSGCLAPRRKVYSTIFLLQIPIVV